MPKANFHTTPGQVNERLPELARRSFLAGVTVPIAATVASSPALGRQPLVGPITPDQYIQEMHAVGRTCFVGCYIDKSGNEVHAGVIARRESDETSSRLQRSP